MTATQQLPSGTDTSNASSSRSRSVGASRSRKRSARIKKAKIPKVELMMLTSQLSIMCETGVEIAEAIEESARQATHPVLKRALIDIFRDINDGKPVAQAMERQRHLFGNAYAASFAAGERSGNMADVLQRQVKILEGEIKLTSMLRSAMAYPVILAGLSFCTLLVLLFFVLPQFGEIFEGMNVPLPASTEFLLGISRSFTELPHLWLLGLGGFIVGVVVFRRNRACQAWKDRMLLNGKFIGEVTRSIMVGRSFRLCGCMIQCGVPVLEAIRMTRSSLTNSVYQRLFDALEAEVLNGHGLGQTLVRASFVPRGASRMVATAEQTGRLGMVMEKVGSFYESDGERRLQEFSKLLEPAIIIGMGVVVSVVVLSILLPMFTLTQMSGAT